MASEFTSDDHYSFINTESAEAYIPDDIFDVPTDDPTASSLAYDTGEYVSTIGIFYMRFYDIDIDDITPEIRDKTKLRTMAYPNKIETRPSGGFKKLTLELNNEPEKFRVYRYSKGDIFMEAGSKQSYLNPELFTKLVMSGRLPKTLTYDELYFSWLDSFRLNGVDTGIPPVLMQAVIARMCRAENDVNVQFRSIAAKKKVNPHSYRMLSMNQVSAYSSVMSSMAFERFSEKLTTSLIMSKEGIRQEPSPIERLITI